MLSLKDQKDIALKLTVTNIPSDARNPQKDGDDAHETKLIATLPDSLTYSAFRELKGSPVSSFPDAVKICSYFALSCNFILKPLSVLI